jgi:branched-chain amino acid transport system permease protein
MGPLDGATESRRVAWSVAPGIERTVRTLVIVGLVALGVWTPAVITSDYWLGLLINAMVGFLAHQSGLMMFGVSALTGGATYIYAIAITWFGLKALPASALTLVVATILFALVGALIVRARPLPFAMLTLALAQLLHSVVLITDFRPVTGGDDGLALSYEGALFGIRQAEMSKAESFWPVCWIAFCSVVALSWVLGRSRFGQVLRAIKANEERMRFSGFDTYTPRVLAFAFAGFIAAVAGLLSGFYTAFASPELLDFSTGGNALVAALIGGVGTLAGPALGALLYVIGQDLFGATGNLELLTGVGVALVIYLFPEGVIGFLRRAASHAAALFGGRRGRPSRGHGRASR